jgi:hypothetical protein
MKIKNIKEEVTKGMDKPQKKESNRNTTTQWKATIAD